MLIVRAVPAVCLWLTLVVCSPAIAQSQDKPIVDLPIDCGGDMRSAFDMQPDVDYPTPPPQQAQPVLTAIGCPPGEPRYDEFHMWGHGDGQGYGFGSPEGEDDARRAKTHRKRRACATRSKTTRRHTRSGKAAKRASRKRCTKRRKKSRR